MQKSIYFYFVIFLLSTANFVNAKQAEILDFYPQCEFKLLGQVSFKSEINSAKPAVGVKKLLNRLQEKAFQQGAQAIVLTKREKQKKKKLRNTADNSSGFKQFYIYTADMLTGCDDYQIASNRSANYNALGNKTLAQNLGGASIEFEIQIPTTTSKKQQYPHKSPSTSEVSMSNGLYGIGLGSLKSQVLTAFGQADIRIQGNNGYELLAFGRKHWLHFQHGKLVSIEYGTYHINQELMNQLPHRTFFDDANWLVNNQYPYKQILNHMQQPKWLKAINSSGTLLFNENGHELQLNFDLVRDAASKQNVFQLIGFRIGQKPSTLVTNISTQNAAKTNLSSLLEQALQADVEQEALSQVNVENAIGVLTSEDEQLWYIFDNHLAIRLNDGILDRVNYHEDIFLTSAKSSTTSKWKISPELQQDFEMTQALTALEGLSGEVMQGSYDISFYKESLELQLFLDDQDKLNEAKFTFY